jgi:hypothetical protein
VENDSEHNASWLFVGTIRLFVLSESPPLPVCSEFWLVAVFYPRNLHERLGHQFLTALRRDEIKQNWILQDTGKLNEEGIAARKAHANTKLVFLFHRTIIIVISVAIQYCREPTRIGLTNGNRGGNGILD